MGKTCRTSGGLGNPVHLLLTTSCIWEEACSRARTARMSFTADDRAMWGPPVAIAAEISSLYCLRCPDMQQASASGQVDGEHTLP